MFKKNTKGFALIEILVVISIIGFLTSFSTYTINNARMKARNTKVKSDIRELTSALNLYYQHYGHYPDVECPFGSMGWSFATCIGLSQDQECWQEERNIKGCDNLNNELLKYMRKIPLGPEGSTCANFKDYLYVPVRNTGILLWIPENMQENDCYPGRYTTGDFGFPDHCEIDVSGDNYGANVVFTVG